MSVWAQKQKTTPCFSIFSPPASAGQITTCSRPPNSGGKPSGVSGKTCGLAHPSSVDIPGFLLVAACQTSQPNRLRAMAVDLKPGTEFQVLILTCIMLWQYRFFRPPSIMVTLPVSTERMPVILLISKISGC